MKSNLNVVELSKEKDIAKAIVAKVGDLPDWPVLGPWVLVGTYIRPNVTKGGIALPDSVIHEDRFQGKVGLVLAMGATAFKYDPDNVACEWEGPKPKVGDWVMFFPSDARELAKSNTSCKMLHYSHVRMIADRPEELW